MPLVKLQFRPGVNKESTSYANEMGWFDSSLIRFRKGRAEKLGGWLKLSTSTILGTVRSLFSWVALDGDRLTGVGTNIKYYIEEGGAYADITPVRATNANTTTFSATNGSAVITAHCALGS